MERGTYKTMTNLETAKVLSIAAREETKKKGGKDGKHSHITDEHFLSMELSNQPPTT